MLNKKMIGESSHHKLPRIQDKYMTLAIEIFAYDGLLRN